MPFSADPDPDLPALRASAERLGDRLLGAIVGLAGAALLVVVFAWAKGL